MCIEWTSFILDLITSVFGSLLGFGFALWAERLVDNYKANADSKAIKKLLIEELKACDDSLRTLDVNSLDIQPLKISLWEGLSHSNQLSLLDVETRADLFNVYNIMTEINSWSHVHTKYYFEKGKTNDLLITEIDRLRNKLLGNDETKTASMIDKAISCLS